MLDLNKKHNYEIMYIIDDQKAEKAQRIKDDFLEILSKNDGEIKSIEDKIRLFAQPIDRKVKGHYFVIKLTTSIENINNFQRIALIKQKQLEIIRFLIINLDNEKVNKFKSNRKVENSSNYRGNRPNNYRGNKNNETGNTDRRTKSEHDNSNQNARSSYDESKSNAVAIEEK